MSTISYPRPIDTRQAPGRRARSLPAQSTPRRAEAVRRWRTSSSARRASIIVVVALAISLAGSMFEANRQIEMHQLQSQLLQDQSTYAEQVGSLSNLSAPSQIATKAGALHLV
ncbi:MAG TPA: hypothetical protein VMF33_00415, partial [Acidimicrobiales bacterium]|nr:hypothetical protein [Acidimicrobiales bacterium]